MRITFIWDGDYPWDIRVEKVCRTLMAEGHEIHLVCRNLARQPLEDQFDGMHLHRLPYLPLFLGRLNDAFSFPAFFSPLWLYRIISVTRRHRCDMIIVRDLPMGLAGTFAAKVTGLPCVLDMAECYPEMLRCTWQFEGKSFRNYFLRNPRLADIVERAVLNRVKQVWVMIEESRDRLLAMGVDGERIKVVSNTPVLERFNRAEVSKEAGMENCERLSLIYVGLLNPSRGLDTTIKAVAKYVKINPDFKLTVVGRGKAENALRQLVVDLGIEKYVQFLGWVDNTEVPRLIAAADIGIVPHHKCGHWDNTIPNKLFDYMATRKPVIVSNVEPMARIVRETNCGMVYTDYNEEELVAVLIELSSLDLRREKAEAGLAAVTNKYNWKKEECVMLEAIADLEVAGESVNG